MVWEEKTKQGTNRKDNKQDRPKTTKYKETNSERGDKVF